MQPDTALKGADDPARWVSISDRPADRRQQFPSAAATVRMLADEPLALAQPAAPGGRTISDVVTALAPIGDKGKAIEASGGFAVDLALPDEIEAAPKTESETA
jgi:hypothetical protein